MNLADLRTVVLAIHLAERIIVGIAMDLACRIPLAGHTLALPPFGLPSDRFSRNILAGRRTLGCPTLACHPLDCHSVVSDDTLAWPPVGFPPLLIATMYFNMIRRLPILWLA